MSMHDFFINIITFGTKLTIFLTKKKKENLYIMKILKAEKRGRLFLYLSNSNID